MNDRFDELAKGLAQSVTRRGAPKKFGLGITGFALASLGLANQACAGHCRPSGSKCMHGYQCCSGVCDFVTQKGFCV